MLKNLSTSEGRKLHPTLPKLPVKLLKRNELQIVCITGPYSEIEEFDKLLIGKFSIEKACIHVNHETNPCIGCTFDVSKWFHEDGEGFLIRSFEAAESAAVRSGRSTLMQKDICFVKYLHR